MMVVIAITGLPGVGTSTIARKLAKKLKLEYFSPGEFFKKHSKKKTQSEQALSYWKTKEGSSKRLHNYIENLQRSMAKKGNIVICGKLSIFALKDTTAIKIWLECSLDERAKRTAKRDGISLGEAKKDIKERERIEDREWKRIYGFSRRAQKKWADFVINSNGLNEWETLGRILDCIPNV